MKIGKFHAKNYKSILDSGEVTLHSRITALIGKNESGKTNVLKALESFDRGYEYTENDLCLHSEMIKKLDSEGIGEGYVEIVTIWFTMESKDRLKLKEIHPKLGKMKTLKLTKYLDNSYSIESPEVSLDELKINRQEEIEKNVLKIRELSESFLDRLNKHSERYVPFVTSQSQYKNILSDILSFDPRKNPDVENIFNDFYNELRNLPNRDSQIQDDIEAFIKEIDPHKNAIGEIQSKKDGLEDQILEFLPNFVYFTDIEKLEDTVEIAEFLSNREGHKTLSNLIELCNLDVGHIEDAGEYEMLSELGSASTTITGMVNQSWTQEKVDVKIAIVKGKIVVSIFDNVIKKEHPPSIRSQGFQWFLSFYINFTAGSRRELKNTIILLDDPGVYLHPSGQKDLLNTLEGISESNQVILSTHSPFMVDRNKLKRTRIVTKREEEGTLIEEKYYESDYDALQPIRAAIGMTIGDSLFAMKKNLLIEGYSDELILEALSDLCSKKKKDHIDRSKISILPVNGAKKMPYFATLLTKENLEFLVLLDYDPEGRSVAKELEQIFNIHENNIITLDIVAEKGNDLEIEDLVDVDFYLEALNLAYSDYFQKKLEKESIGKEDLPEVSFKGIKKFFREKRIETNRRIDKIKVAKKIHDSIAEDRFPDEQTISNFSKLFKIINERIGKNIAVGT
jgi:predicted ATP-dependent endonuclease of OLD family